MSFESSIGPSPPNGFVGDIKRKLLKPLNALELLAAMADEAVDSNYDDDDA